MKIHLTAELKSGIIQFVQSDLLAEFKTKLEEGKLLSITIEQKEIRTDKTIALFDELKDRFAISQNYEKSYARNLLKYRHGPAYRVDILRLQSALDNLPSRPGRFFEVDNGIVYLVSTNDYEQQEANQLVEGTIKDCIDAEVGIGDIVR